MQQTTTHTHSSTCTDTKSCVCVLREWAASTVSDTWEGLWLSLPPKGWSLHVQSGLIGSLEEWESRFLRFYNRAPTVIRPVAHILLDRSYDHRPRTQGAVNCKECYKSEHWDVMRAYVSYIRLQVGLRLYPCHCSTPSAWDSTHNTVQNAYWECLACVDKQ